MHGNRRHVCAGKMVRVGVYEVDDKLDRYKIICCIQVERAKEASNRI